MAEDNCPCRVMTKDARSYKDCCQPYILDHKSAPTAEALMRSRYSALLLEILIISLKH